MHRGFYAAYHNTILREQVVTAVQSIQQDRSELGVTITGHSMGGAMAAFCALDLTVCISTLSQAFLVSLVAELAIVDSAVYMH